MVIFVSGSLGFKQKHLLKVLEEKSFIPLEDAKRIYPVPSQRKAAIQSLELMKLVVWNETLKRWDKYGTITIEKKKIVNEEI